MNRLEHSRYGGAHNPIYEALAHFTPSYIAQEKDRVLRLMRIFRLPLKKGDMSEVTGFSLERAVGLFGLEDLTSRAQGKDTFEDGEFKWSITNKLIHSDRPKEVVECQKSGRFASLMKVERSGTVTTASGRVLARSATVDMLDPAEGSLRATIEVTKHMLVVKAQAQDLALLSGKRLTSAGKGIFTHEGEYVTPGTQI